MNHAPSCPAAQLASMIASLEWKPAKPIPSGLPNTAGSPTPVIASVPAIIAQKVTGIERRSPP